VPEIATVFRLLICWSWLCAFSWAGHIGVPNRLATVRAFLLVRLPRKVRLPEKSFHRVATLVLAEELTLADATARADKIAEVLGRGGGIVLVGSHLVKG
jgi:hypothetical protein